MDQGKPEHCISPASPEGKEGAAGKGTRALEGGTEAVQKLCIPGGKAEGFTESLALQKRQEENSKGTDLEMVMPPVRA